MPLIKVNTNKTYTDLYGDHFNNLVVFGNDEVQDEFQAHLKLELWGEEYISLCEEGVAGVPSVRTIDVGGHDESCLEMDLPEVKHQWYRDAKSLTQTCRHSLKWIHNFKVKPASNKIIHKFVGEGWKQFDYHYQTPQPYDEIIERDGEQYYRKNYASGPARYDEQPVKMRGGYVVYHKTKRGHSVGGKNYRTGKVLSIPRPKATDAIGNWVWVDLHIENGIYTETIPQSFLDTAVYPVKVNATFGYATVGDNSTAWDADYLTAVSHDTAPGGGTVTAMDFYATGLSKTKMHIGYYDDSSDTPNNLVAQALATEDADGWINRAVSGSLTGSAKYWFAAHWDADTLNIFYDIVSGYSLRYKADAYAVGGMDDPFGTSIEGYTSRRYSIYATYTPDAGPQVTFAGTATIVSSAIGLMIGLFILAGSAAAVSSAAGDMSVSKSLAGLAASTSSASGGMTVARPMAGTADGVSSASGDMLVGRGMVGIAAGTSTATGQMSLTVSLAGSSAPVSSATADLTATFVLAGTTDGASSAAADLTVTSAGGAEVLMAGVANAVSSATGGLSISKRFSGSAAAVSSSMASLSLSVRFTGQVAAVSSAAGNLVATLVLGGSTDVVSSAVGDMTVPSGAEVTFVGTADGVSSASGGLSISVGLSGSATGATTATGHILLRCVLTGSSTPASWLPKAEMVLSLTLAGSADAVSAVTGALFDEFVWTAVYGVPFLYEAANWGDVSFYLEVRWRATTGTVYARLYNITDDEGLDDSEITTAETSMIRTRSAAISLTDQKEYTIQFGKEGSDAGEYKGAKLIAA